MIEVTRTDEELFPFSVVRWDIESPTYSRITVDKRLWAHSRYPFFENRLLSTIELLDGGHALGKLRPASFKLNLDDRPAMRGLAFCSAHPDDHLLIPDPVFMRMRGYKHLRDIWARRCISWEDRMPIVFWRGSSSGKAPDNDWRKLPRVILCQLAASRPDLFDVGISIIAQITREAELGIENAGLKRDFTSDAALHNYRYHVDIDGNSNSWPGLFMKLLTGSPVLKVASPSGYRQWYYDRLRPWENFVPVATDMSDLIPNAEWLATHPVDAVRIGLAGKELADSISLESEKSATADRIVARASQ